MEKSFSDFSYYEKKVDLSTSYLELVKLIKGYKGDIKSLTEDEKYKKLKDKISMLILML